MTESDDQEMFKIVDAIMWAEAERYAAGSTLSGRLSVAQTHRSMWRLLEKGRIYLATEDAEHFIIKYCPWWRWRTRRNYAASVRWLVEMHQRRMAV